MIRPSTSILVLALLVPGCGGKPADPRVQTVSGMTAQFAPVPDPPHVGHDSGFTVALAENGAPVQGARVQIATFFKGLNQTGPAGPMMEAGPGRYQASELSTGMNGKWEAVVTVSRANQPDAQFKFPFTVAK
jgi:hypothetical protein